MSHDFGAGIAVIYPRFEDLNTPVSNHASLEAPDKLLGLPRKHGAADCFDPAGIGEDYIQCVTIIAHIGRKNRTGTATFVSQQKNRT
jgi:hypothetical protein